MLTPQHVPPPLTSTVKSSLSTHTHSSPLSLAARLHQCHSNCSHYINNGWTFSGQYIYVGVCLYVYICVYIYSILVYIHIYNTHISYIYIKFSHKNEEEILPFVTVWIDFESIMLSKISQTERQILYDLICRN